MKLLNLTKTTLQNCTRLVMISATTIVLMFAATNAIAACGDPAGFKSPGSVELPVPIKAVDHLKHNSSSTSIVGLWSVTYTSGGALFYQAYDQWHSDQTEFENANLSPVEGNVCVGVWKQIGPRTVSLNHVGWSFDDTGTSNGTFTLTETNTLSSEGNSYKGTFDYKFFDTNGTLQQEITGTIAATRITVD